MLIFHFFVKDYFYSHKNSSFVMAEKDRSIKRILLQRISPLTYDLLWMVVYEGGLKSSERAHDPVICPG